MDLLIKLNGTKARMLYRQDRADARYALHDAMRGGCVLVDAWLEYRIIDALHALDTEPALLEDEVWLSVSVDPSRYDPDVKIASDELNDHYHRP